MDRNLKESIWQQFGASIDFLDATIHACPDSLWTASLWQTHNYAPELAQFWYVSYHTLFWLDLYLTGTEEGFLPPAQFLLIDQWDGGPIPERVYTKAELLAYLADCRQKCQTTIEALTDETIQRHCVFGWGECSFLELLIYNLRHVHGHASQLNMLLGQHGIESPDYVTQIRNKRS
ncbi:MAG TPA: DinB family protein [Phototrophicaceae bacterium]|nr:DinB family protein [Phototrophicaceae bacterium]